MLNTCLVSRLDTGQILRFGTMGTALHGVATPLVTSTGWAAVIGDIQYGSDTVGAALVGVLANGTPAPMGMTISGLGRLISAILAEQHGTV